MKGYVIYVGTKANGEVSIGNTARDFMHSEPSLYELQNVINDVQSRCGYSSVSILNVINLCG